MDETRLRTTLLISADPLDPAALANEVASPESGATVVFAGTARDHSPGKTGVTHLEYEAYPDQVALFDSYHCSRYNTNTRRLTTEMFEDVFRLIDRELGRA